MIQIPEDLQSVLTDTNFFKENSEVTTKEILKRYGDIARGSFSQRPANGGETFTITNQNRGANTPTSARIETDPSQDAATQLQGSVRHVQGPPGHAHSASGIPELVSAASAMAVSRIRYSQMPNLNSCLIELGREQGRWELPVDIMLLSLQGRVSINPRFPYFLVL